MVKGFVCLDSVSPVAIENYASTNGISSVQQLSILSIFNPTTTKSFHSISDTLETYNARIKSFAKEAIKCNEKKLIWIRDFDFLPVESSLLHSLYYEIQRNISSQSPESKSVIVLEMSEKMVKSLSSYQIRNHFAVLEIGDSKSASSALSITRKTSGDDVVVIGYEEIKSKISEIIGMDSRKLSRMGITRSRGILLHGPSGNGKSNICEWIKYKFSYMNIVEIKVSEVLSSYLGESERFIRNIFTEAKKKQSLIIIDNVEVLCRRRSNEGQDLFSRILSTFLNEIDGIESGSSDKTLLIACTNQLQSIDEAFLRPGRLDQLIEVDYPKAEDKKKLAEFFTKKYSAITSDKTNNLGLPSELFDSGEKMSVADIETLIRQSCVGSLMKRND